MLTRKKRVITCYRELLQPFRVRRKTKEKPPAQSGRDAETSATRPMG
jgi:hypothetical protein